MLPRIEYYKGGGLMSVFWYKNDKLHREEDIEKESWYKLHKD